MAEEDLEESETSLETLPDVMEELLKRNIISSPFKWDQGDCLEELTSIFDSPKKQYSIETLVDEFRKKMSKVKPSLFDVSSMLLIIIIITLHYIVDLAV